MPRLSSGRHVATSATPFFDAIESDSDTFMYYAILAIRLYASTPAALRDHLPIFYFVEGAGTPPDAPCYYSGYCVSDVLEGRSDWSEKEVEEFRAFLMEPRFAAWFDDLCVEIDQAIQNSPVWSSELLQDDSGMNEVSAAMIKRAVIERSVMEQDAMTAIRDKARKAEQSTTP